MDEKWINGQCEKWNWGEGDDENEMGAKGMIINEMRVKRIMKNKKWAKGMIEKWNGGWWNNEKQKERKDW